jgi:hypothetical protein
MKKVLLFSIAAYGSVCMAQEVVSSSGESYTNSSGQIDYTIGEPLIETVSDSANQLTQGFHQPVIQVTEIGDHFSDTEMVVYPNPTNGSLTIQLNELPNGLKYLLFDATGKLVMTDEVRQSRSTIDMNGFASGQYVLKFSNNSTSFQIQKTN